MDAIAVVAGEGEGVGVAGEGEGARKMEKGWGRRHFDLYVDGEGEGADLARETFIK